MATAISQRLPGKPDLNIPNPSHPSAPGGATFPRSVRLLKRADFERVYQNGRRHFSSSMTVFYRVLPPAEGEAGSVRAGLTVSRALGGSVERNRIKRRMRDVIRHRLGELAAALGGRRLSAELVINPKKIVLRAERQVLDQEVGRAFAVIAAEKVKSA